MGHFFRMMNLVAYLEVQKVSYIVFINEHAPSLEILRGARMPFEVVALDDLESDWESRLIKQYGIKVWINDRLNTDIRHADNVKRHGIGLVTFDDKGSGAAAADLHVAALAFEAPERLRGRKVLCGAEYLILNRGIEKFKRRRLRAEQILVTLGGSDTYGVTGRIMAILKRLGKTATVLLGPAFEGHDLLRGFDAGEFTIKHGVPSLIEEFSRYDLAVTGGGITAFEANASGLPCIIVANEVFEIPAAEYLERLGSSVFAGYYTTINEAVFNRPLDIEVMSRLGMGRISTEGARKVYRELQLLS